MIAFHTRTCDEVLGCVLICCMTLLYQHDHMGLMGKLYANDE